MTSYQYSGPPANHESRRAYEASWALLEAGTFPTPTKVARALGLQHTRNLNGRKTVGRTQALEEAGYCKHHITGRWRPPQRLVSNAAQCGVCHEIIESRHRHDFVTCRCGNVSVDGGLDYIRRAFVTRNYTDVCQHEPAPLNPRPWQDAA